MIKNLYYQQEIKEYCSQFVGKRGSKLQCSILSLPQYLIDYLNYILQENSNWQKILYIVKGICLNIDLPRCKTCGKEMKFSKYIYSYCCKSCVQQNKEIRTKIQKTNINRYGSKSPLQNKKVKLKREQNNLRKYGVKNPIILDSVQEKLKQTNLLKYGVEYPAQNQQVKQKMKQTCLNKYSTQYTGSTQLVIKKRQNTMLEKYGTIIPNQVPYISEKISKTNLNKFYQNIILNEFSKANIVPLFSIDEYIGHSGKNSKRKYLFKCLTCGNIFQTEIKTTNFNQINLQVPRCWNCFPSLSHTSKAQQELINFCKQYFSNLEDHKTDLIRPYEVDIFIPELKLAIEYNGLYWHNIFKKPIGYHLNKFNMCNKLGINLIFIWQHQWNLKNDLIKQFLVQLFNNNRSVHYTKTYLKYIDFYKQNFLIEYLK